MDRDCYPSHLLPLCLTNFRDYAAQVLTPQTRQSEDSQVLVHDGDVHLEMSGNWSVEIPVQKTNRRAALDDCLVQAHSLDRVRL